MTNDLPPIWEQRENESSKAYAAFLSYRDMGKVLRTIEQAWLQYRNGNKTGAMPGYFRDWSSGNDWVARCRAWDKHQQGKAESALDDLRQKKRIEIVNAELDDYEQLRAQWQEQSKYIRPVEVKTVLEDGRQVNILKSSPYEFKAHIEARKRISEGLRLFAELPSKIERNEQTGEGGKELTIRIRRGKKSDD